MNDLHDREPKPEIETRKLQAALLMVGMACVTLILIAWACAWGWKG